LRRRLKFSIPSDIPRYRDPFTKLSRPCIQDVLDGQRGIPNIFLLEQDFQGDRVQGRNVHRQIARELNEIRLLSNDPSLKSKLDQNPDPALMAVTLKKAIIGVHAV
jgi:hypothetical protein